MIRRTIRIWLVAGLLATILALPAGAATGVQLTPVGRVPFPQRAFVIDLPQQVGLGQLHVSVRENGELVRDPTVTPVGSSGLRFGAVLAVDASLSMKGEPFAAALAAAGAFLSHRAANEQVGLVAFNGGVKVLQPLTGDQAKLQRALATPTPLAYGTHIYDGLGRALQLLERAKISAGSIIVLSDGADVGSRSTLAKVIARANKDSVRIFSVGLRSKAFQPLPLARLGNETGGSFSQTATTSQLAGIYAEISGRLASEYLLQYRSSAAPGTPVTVTAQLGSFGSGASQYTAPTPSGLKPFHRSLLSRFLLSPLSLVLLSLLAAGVAAWMLVALLAAAPKSDVVGRIGGFVGTAKAAAAVTELRKQRSRRGGDAGSGVLARLENDFEIGEISMSPAAFLAGSLGGAVLAAILLGAVAKPLFVLGFLVPVFSFAWVRRKVKKVRDTFADQLPETLQLLASALRSGHSLIGALSVVVESAPEPARREFQQIVTDDQIGIPIEDSVRRVAARMKSRDMVQVAVLAELQRTAGGNAADVLDTVVGTVRERAQVRRLARTLTVQGRMARVILSILPVVLALAMLLIEPVVTKPLFTSTIGQVALVFAAVMVVIGSFWIQKIVEIEV